MAAENEGSSQTSFRVYVGYTMIFGLIIILFEIMLYFTYKYDVVVFGESSKIRNSLELVYFVTNSLVALSVWVALLLARNQFAEARNARLASVYTELEARWSSTAMVKSREVIKNLLNEAVLRRVVVHDYFRSKLPELRNNNYEGYISVLSLADFLEYVGMLESRGYLNIEDIEPLVGRVAVYTGIYLSSHIIDLREESKRSDSENGFTTVTEDYFYFSKLVKKFQARFGYTE